MIVSFLANKSKINFTSCPRGETELVFGKVKTFKVKIEVRNKGENAFLSKMNVAFSNDFRAAGVEFVNVSFQCYTLILKLVSSWFTKSE